MEILIVTLSFDVMSQSSDAENREREGGTEQVEKLESLTVVDGICLLGVCVVKF